MYQWKLRASDDRSSTSTDDQVVIRIVQSEIDFAHETPDVRGKIGEFLVGHHSEIGGMAQRHQPHVERRDRSERHEADEVVAAVNNSRAALLFVLDHSAKQAKTIFVVELTRILRAMPDVVR